MYESDSIINYRLLYLIPSILYHPLTLLYLGVYNVQLLLSVGHISLEKYHINNGFKEHNANYI